jgi:opacity protein-like surface antigen
MSEVQAQETDGTSSEEEQTSRREVRLDVGGGWGIPIDNVDLQSEAVQGPLEVNLNSGPHAYAGVGFVRSIAENFALGARLRGQATRLRSSVDICDEEGIRCQDPDGLLWAATLEGRIIITAPDWINPYLLVGLGVVNTTVDATTVQVSQNSNLPGSIPFSESSVVDAGGDIGLGASLPLTDHLYLDAEFRVTGALPGGKENAVTVLPFSAGLSYAF